VAPSSADQDEFVKTMNSMGAASFCGNFQHTFILPSNAKPYFDNQSTNPND
jgi:hypothetical protein